MQIIKGENRLIKLEEPLEEVYHDATLTGKGTKGSKLRTNGGGVHDSTLFGDGTASQPLTTYTADDIILTEDGKGILTEDGNYLLVESAILVHGIYDGDGSLSDNTTVGLNGKQLSFQYQNTGIATALSISDESGSVAMVSPDDNTYIDISSAGIIIEIGSTATSGFNIGDIRDSINRTGAQYTNTISFANNSIVDRDYADGLAIGSTNTIDASSVVGRYRALLSQSGTDAPVAFVTLNTLAGDVVWSRDSLGVYYGTLASAFPSNYTHCLANYTPLRGGVANVSLGVLGDGDTLILYALNASTGNPEEINCGTAWDVSIDVTVYNN